MTNTEAMSSPPAVLVTGLCKQYGDVSAVEDVTLELPPGSFTAILGPSGCGKSTTLQMLAGLVAPDGGAVCVDGRDMRGIPAEKRPVSLVFQKPLLFPHLSVAQNVAFGLRMRRESRDVIAEQVAAMLHRVQLNGLGSRRVHELSGGQEQRVALARALVLRPSVLLLDEPFSQLDAALRVEMRHLVRELHEATGVTTVFVTHDQGEAVDVADRIVLMLDGRIEGAGSPEQLYTRPPTLRTARFLGVTNEISGTVEGGVFDARPSPVTVAAPGLEGPAILTIRPESVRLLPPSSVDGSLSVRVGSVRFAGTHLVVETRMSDGQRLTVHAPIGTPVEVGESVGVDLPLDRCTVFGKESAS